MYFPKGHTNVFATIVVPVRNEEAHIERLIRSIYKNENTDFEVIVVDDHSNDQTVEIVKDLTAEFENLSFDRLPESQSGKKAAITFGVELANADLIVCTDGDGEVSEGWLDEHKRAYSVGAKLSFGPVRLMNSKRRFQIDMLNLELSALVGVGATTLKLGKPTMINGCNYSFSKEVFIQVKGFEGNEHVASGDDEFLLRKIHEAYPLEVKFLQTSEALVSSEPPETWNSFYNQRKRWASKWKLHNDAFSKIIPVLVFGAYFVWGFLLIETWMTQSAFGLILIGAKCLVDYLFVFTMSKVRKKGVNILSFISLQIIYPFYVVFFGVASNFGQYKWRDRSHRI